MNKANPTLIGLFTIGGIILVVMAVMLFANQQLFVEKRFFVAYFEQSVVGLNLGAPVRFRGIPIGEVVTIDGVFDPDEGSVTPRLILEIHPETLDNAVLQEDEYTLFKPLVEHGMRASLKTQSFLTGQLYVSLDFHPDKPVRRLGSDRDPFPEIPTIDSGFDKVLSKLEDLPVEQVMTQMGNTLLALEQLLKNPGLLSAIDGLPSLVRNADTTMVDADTMLVDVNALLASDVKDMIGAFNQLAKTGSSSLDTLSTQLSGETLVSFRETMSTLQATLGQLQTRLDVNDPLSFEIINALREISASARSLQQLADYLEEHPEALLKGKSK